MPTSFKFTVRLEVDRDIIWRIRASRTFMQFLVRNGALSRMEATAAVPADNATSNTCMTRRQIYVSADIVIPEIIKPLLDDSYIEISDSQTWDDAAPYVQRSVIHPAILGELITTEACLTLLTGERADGDGVGDDAGDGTDDSDGGVVSSSCLHSLSGSVGVAVPFLGSFVEQAVVSNMKQFYADYPRHISDFVQFAVAEYGDGSVASLSSAVDRILAEDAKLS